MSIGITRRKGHAAVIPASQRRLQSVVIGDVAVVDDGDEIQVREAAVPRVEWPTGAVWTQAWTRTYRSGTGCRKRPSRLLPIGVGRALAVVVNAGISWCSRR